jgi:hypothetical protein
MFLTDSTSTTHAGFYGEGTSFEREDWAVTVDGVAHLRLVITPDKGGHPCLATISSLVVR